jgi:hypothetical protein
MAGNPIDTNGSIGVAPKRKTTNASASSVEGASQVKPNRATITASDNQTIKTLYRGVVSHCIGQACETGQCSNIG